MDRQETVLQTVARILGEVFPDSEIVDRDLAIGRGRSIQLAAVDAGGRLLLVLLAEESGDEIALAALDALAYARRNAQVLTSHFHSARLRPELPPLLVVVAASFDDVLLARLGALDPRLVRAFELRHVASSRGAGDYLAEIDPAGPAQPRERASEPAGFLDALDPERRELGERLLRRIARLDEELQPTRRGQGLAWRLHDELVCSLTAREGAIEGQVPGTASVAPIETRDDVEGFLETIVQRYLSVIRGRPPGAPRGASSAFGREPLLTPEELAAFEPTK